MRIVLQRSFQSPLIKFPKFAFRRFSTSRRFYVRNMSVAPKDVEFVREDLDDLLKRRFFLARGFDIYGGVAGLYDLGVQPPNNPLSSDPQSSASKSSWTLLTAAPWMRVTSQYHRYMASSLHSRRRHARSRLYNAYTGRSSQDVGPR